MIRDLLPKHLPGAREGESGERKVDFRRIANTKERRRRVGASGSLRERSEEMTKLNTSSPWSQKYLMSSREGDGS